MTHPRYAALAAAGALALAAAGGPHAGGPHTLSLSLTPPKIVTASHHSDSKVTVTNLSGGTVKITTSAIQLGGASCAAHPAPSWVHVTPARFTLARNARQVTTVTVAAPASAAGSYDLAAVYRARPDGTDGTGFKVSAAAGARILLSLGGSSSPARACTTVALASADGPAASPPWALLGTLAALLAIGVTWYRRRRSHRLALAPVQPPKRAPLWQEHPHR